LPDTILYRLEVLDLQINGGPGRNANALTPADLRTDLSGAEALMAAVPALIGTLDAGALAAAAGAGPGAWRVISVDPEGIDLGTGSDAARLTFAQRVETPEALQAVLAAPA